MAVLIMTPLISADTGEGAAGCASGSHAWSGSIPALAPKPKKARRKATLAPAGSRRAARSPALPAWLCFGGLHVGRGEYGFPRPPASRLHPAWASEAFLLHSLTLPS